MRKTLGAAMLGAAVIATGAMAPGIASAQQTWTYGYDRGRADAPAGRDWGPGRNWGGAQNWGAGRNWSEQRDRDAFDRGYRMGREEERRFGQGRNYGRDWGTGGEARGYGYGYGGGYGPYRGPAYGYRGEREERDEGWFDGGLFD